MYPVSSDEIFNNTESGIERAGGFGIGQRPNRNRDMTVAEIAIRVEITGSAPLYFRISR